MNQGVYKIADAVFQISSIHSQVQELCRDYRSGEPVEMTVEITQADIDQERVYSEKQNRLEGLPVRNYSDGYLETLAVYRKLAELLVDRDVLLFHGSAISVDGEAYLFTAPSGTGKSTHTRLWREHFGSRAVMVNDDKPLLKITDSGIIVYGTPWDGKHRLSQNISVPLKAICFLHRGEENRICPISTGEALPMLLQQTNRSRNRKKLIHTIDLLSTLVERTSLYRLECNMAPEAAVVSYQGMQK